MMTNPGERSVSSLSYSVSMSERRESHCPFRPLKLPPDVSSGECVFEEVSQPGIKHAQVLRPADAVPLVLEGE